MFTGIVEDVGRLVRSEPLAAGRRLWVSTGLPTPDFALGESIAIAGACMTVVAVESARFAVDVSPESLRRTTLGDLSDGDAVNLERATQVGSRLGGHIVTGHVDATGTVDSTRNEGESRIVTFRIPAELTTLLVEKGSVAVDGTSLTCFHLRDCLFDVAAIPHTLAVSTLGIRRPGDRVNIETDVLARHVQRLVDAALAARST